MVAQVVGGDVTALGIVQLQRHRAPVAAKHDRVLGDDGQAIDGAGAPLKTSSGIRFGQCPRP